MADWRERVLREFPPQAARLTLVADPDRLLVEESIHDELRRRGFALVVFEDSMTFRYVFEANFRSRWDAGEEVYLVVVVEAPLEDLSFLPYDLWHKARRLSFRLADFFPNLSCPVVATLDRAHLDRLYRAQRNYPPKALGETGTKDYILRHVFEIASEMIQTPVDLLRTLLRRHYNGLRVPGILDAYFIHVMRQKRVFQKWPLEAIVPDRAAFFSFLQEYWPRFLDKLAEAACPPEENESRERPIPPWQGTSSDVLPFDHDDIRVYMDNLFVEGLLKPVEHENAQCFADLWVKHGVKIPYEEGRLSRLEGLMKIIETSLPDAEARHEDWLRFGQRWGELIALVAAWDRSLPEAFQERLKGLMARVDGTFTQWLWQRYGSLVHLPPDPPVMVHHLPRYLARKMEQDPAVKPALVLVDGLALDQWYSLRPAFEEQDEALRMRERAVFAWIPTLTSVSRQAAFSGKAPVFFQESVHSAQKESQLWIQFWEEHGLKRGEVVLTKAPEENGWNELADLLSRPNLKVLGLVIQKVDKIMHGMELGTAGMHSQIRQWARQGVLKRIVGLLHAHGFSVHLTSDHGNIEARGVGKPAEGVVADVRGERVRIYRDAALRAQIKQRFPSSLEWPPIGLPQDYLPLIAPHRAAFVQENKSVVVHGGISMEEVIVPLVEFDGKGS